MYEELIMRLLEDKSWIEQGTTETEHEIADHLQKAANAIEELSGLISRYGSGLVNRYGGETGIKNLQEYASKYWDLLKNAPRWISVTKILPENIDDEVLVCTEDYGKSGLGFVTVAVYDGNGWLECWERKTYLTAVTHWMPLPEPPEEELA